MNYFKTALVLWAITGFTGCDESKPKPNIEASSPGQMDNFITPIKDQKITGEVRNTKFIIEQAIFENGTLILRQGKEFFADVSVEVVTFGNEDVAGKTFSSSVPANQFKPHIRLSIKKEGENLPDQITLMSDYELTLNFGENKDLGIPFSIKLISLKNGTSIEGKSFATYENIKVVNDVVDTQLDSFDTLEYLAKQYISKHNKGLKIGQRFGVTYASYGSDYPKSGFVGYETTAQSGQSVVKIQLAKDKNGWKVTNQLSINQIHQAHPVLTNIEGNLRTVEGAKANQVAAQKLETYLNEQNLIRNIRSTSINCYLTKTAHKASCRAIYGLKNKDKTTCHSKTYLLTNDKNSWKFESVILDTQKVDYKSGELVTKKPFAMMCQ